MLNRLKRAWNVFMNKDPTRSYWDYGSSFGYRPDRMRFSRGNERSIVTSVYNRIALDVAAINVRHVKLDEFGRFFSMMDSKFNHCLTLEANIDQSHRAFIQDIVMSMMDEGCVAIVATDTTGDPTMSDNYDIRSMRTGKIIQWFPKHIRVNVYNENTGEREDITLPKRCVAIVENPLYAVINEPSSTMQRLVRKLNLLDAIDEQSGSGKLDIFVQVPYAITSDARQQKADKRKKDLEDQLRDSKYGVAYIDATEKITQVNRPVENNLMGQIEYLTEMLYSQLGITKEILDGSASDAMMLNYHHRTIEPIVAAIVDAMKRVFLSRTARGQRQTISYFRDPFKLATVNTIAEVADKFTRNEIMTSNEIRQLVGLNPSKDPEADTLRNKNIKKDDGGAASEGGKEDGGMKVVSSTKNSPTGLRSSIAPTTM